MTLLRRDICNIDGSENLVDVDTTTNIPTECFIPLSVEFKEHGIADGQAWVENHVTSRFPWIFVLMFFWCIKPIHIKYVCVQLKQENKIFDFSFPFDNKVSLFDNILNAPDSIGIKQVWFDLDKNTVV